MENNNPDHAPLNEFDSQEQERLENWKALQIALGLVPDENPIPASQITTPKAPPPTRQPAPKQPITVDAHEVDAEEIVTGPAVEEFEPTEPVAPGAEPTDQEVEVGEAPEEVPEEPSEEAPAGGEKRRRRPRRRRRRDGAEPGAERPVGTDAPLATDPSAPEPAADGDMLEEGEDEGDEDEEEEIEPLSIPDWNVPTWQELIASLYRPER